MLFYSIWQTLTIDNIKVIAIYPLIYLVFFDTIISAADAYFSSSEQSVVDARVEPLGMTKAC